MKNVIDAKVLMIKNNGTHLPTGREMADMAVEAGAIDMAQGVVHTAPPKIFLDKLNERFKERRMHTYASPAGYKEYRAALLNRLQRERADLTLEEVMATNGVTGGVVSALRTVCAPGDKVGLLEPFYPAHNWAIQAIQAVTEYIPYNTEFKLNWETIGQKIPGLKALLIGNPANPTGTVIDKDDLEKLYNLCVRNNVLLVMDEVYQDFIWENDYTSLLSLASDLNHLVICRSFSKNLALAGWRTGYAITAPERRANMTHIHEALYVGAPAPAQLILADLWQTESNQLDRFVSDLVGQYRNNRIRIMAAFEKYGMEPVSPQGAYYMMVKHNRASDMAAMQELLDKGIAVAPGIPFFRPGSADTGYLRAHFALSPDDVEKVEVILGAS